MVKEYSRIETEVKKINWKFASENLDDDLHTDIQFLSTSIDLMKEVAGVSYSRSLLIYEGHKGSFYYPDNEAREINSYLIRRLNADISWGESINKNIIIKSIELESVWEPYHNLQGFSDCSTAALIDLYNQQLTKHCELYKYAWIPEILQDPDYGIEQHLVNMAKRYEPSFTKKEVLSLVPDNPNHTVYYKHDLAILGIIETILADKNLLTLFTGPVKYIRTSLSYALNQRIRHLIKRFGYLGYHGYDERRPYDFNYYLHLIKNYLESQDELDSLKRRIENAPHRSSLWERLTREEKRLISVYHNWGATKARRRLSQLKNFYFLDKLIEEIAFRYQMPEDYIRFMTPQEINNLFASGHMPIGVEKRAKSCICYLCKKDTIFLDENSVDPVSFKKRFPDNHTPIVLQGSIACEGYRIGKALLINRKSDLFASRSTDCRILIAKEADPDIFCIFDKIDAIVTDQGGVTCHIASLAREYGIPCIVGTQYATSIISQGDLVEVNANVGIVRIINKANSI